MQCTGFSSWWLLLLQSASLRVHGLQQLWHMGSVVVADRLSCSMACGNLPGQEIEPMSPALVGGFFTILENCLSLGFRLRLWVNSQLQCYSVLWIKLSSYGHKKAMGFVNIGDCWNSRKISFFLIRNMKFWVFILNIFTLFKNFLTFIEKFGHDY